MPIYEFYCQSCHTLYSFFSAGVRTDAGPDCPKCHEGPLKRRPSTFATLKHQGDDEEASPLDHLDDAQLEGAMATLAKEMEQMGDTDNPQQLGRLFRRFGESTGLEMGPRMEDALQRLEAGEDLESVEADMGDAAEGEDALDDFFQLRKAVARRRAQPSVDDTLYFL